MEENREITWVGLAVFLGVIFVVALAILDRILRERRSVIFERDEYGRITAIHYV
jgi:hypothetical protein